MLSKEELPIVWLIDTSVFLNVLDVSGFNQNREEALASFKQRIERGDLFLLPYASILETGNHIAQLNGNYKFTVAEKFCMQVKDALNGNAPWKPLEFPQKDKVLMWLNEFPTYAGQGIGFADFSIIQEALEQQKLYRGYSVQSLNPLILNTTA